MKIEEGKFYRCRQGFKIGPMKLMPDVPDYSSLVWAGEVRHGQFLRFDNKGFWAAKAGPTEYDLIAEWVDGVQDDIYSEGDMQPIASATQYSGERKGPVVPVPLSRFDLSDPVIPPAAPEVAFEGYAALRAVLDEAYNQSAHGKGKERHANELPFQEQPIMQVSRVVGSGFPSGQAIKKIGEAMGMAGRGEIDRAVHELLGAIVYTAATVVYLREQQK